MSNSVDITFDCLPLRSVGRFDVPLDASAELVELAHQLQAAAKKHGLHNTYFLHSAQCIFHLTNDAQIGMVCFDFRGTVLTDPEDLKTVDCRRSGSSSTGTFRPAICGGRSSGWSGFGPRATPTAASLEWDFDRDGFDGSVAAGAALVGPTGSGHPAGRAVAGSA